MNIKLKVTKKKDAILDAKSERKFWLTIGSLKSDIKLSDEELAQARIRFEKEWFEYEK